MFDIWRLNRQLDKVDETCSKHLERLRKQGATNEEMEAAQQLYADDIFLILEKIKKVVTRNLVLKAQRHFLPVPPHGTKPFWEAGRYTGDYYLTEEGIKKVWNEIYEQRKTWCQVYVPLITIITGLIGAAIGFIALWRK